MSNHSTYESAGEIAGRQSIEEPIIVACPRCGAKQEDLDGFGVVFCPQCKYCVHPARDGDGKGGWVCRICGDVKRDEDYLQLSPIEDQEAAIDKAVERDNLSKRIVHANGLIVTAAKMLVTEPLPIGQFAVRLCALQGAVDYVRDLEAER